ncbi:MAG TPA: 3'-5' exonuclease, partial [Myxococcota bacterium]|nr:3'-5' exonuclease [Myxococcota bacterium]
PEHILGVTFTNKAAHEMRERVQILLPGVGNAVLLGTFHGIAARFLRGVGELVGVPRDFLIYDEDDAVRLIKKIIKERYVLSKDELSALIKKVLRSREAPVLEDGIKSTSNDRALSILELYQERLMKIGALDFSGLLQKLLELLEHEEGAQYLCGRYRHVVVDEYQDINAIQSRIVHILAQSAQSMAIVGDDDQSIYGWRGASAHYMQHFLSSFKDAKLFRLEDNYRSTKPILDGANALIAHNKERLGKNLRSILGEGPLLRIKQHYRDGQEAQAVIEQCLRLFEQYGSQFAIAVLMRTNAQSRPLEEALHRARMPYRMVGGMRFYDRKEIKDILAGLRVVLYQNSDVDMLRLLNAMPLGIGKKTQDALSIYAGNLGLSFFETMDDDEHQASALGNARSKKKLSAVVDLLREMREELVQVLPDGEVRILRADEAIIYVIDKFGIAKRLEQKSDDESESRLENIEQLVQAAVSFVEQAEALGEPADAQSFLENVALISKDESVIEEGPSNMGTVTLMTLHAAKGLEFDGVFLVGLEEGVLPHSRSLHGSDEERQRSALEEERRLLYVGMTRAKKRLFLSHCQERFLHGKTAPSIPSRFLREIPLEIVEESDRHALGMKAERLFISSRRIDLDGFSVPRIKETGPRVIYDDPDMAEERVRFMTKGARVYHQNYQHGHIVSLSGTGMNMRAQV